MFCVCFLVPFIPLVAALVHATAGASWPVWVYIAGRIQIDPSQLHPPTGYQFMCTPGSVNVCSKSELSPFVAKPGPFPLPPHAALCTHLKPPSTPPLPPLSAAQCTPLPPIYPSLNPQALLCTPLTPPLYPSQSPGRCLVHPSGRVWEADQDEDKPEPFF